jgi:hypothetical protein
MLILCITRMKNGSSRAKKMRCQKRFWMPTLGDLQPDKELRGSHLIDTNSGNANVAFAHCHSCVNRMARPFISRRT